MDIARAGVGEQDCILRPGETCWKLALAECITFVIDAAAYFTHLKTLVSFNPPPAGYRTRTGPMASAGPILPESMSWTSLRAMRLFVPGSAFALAAAGLLALGGGIAWRPRAA